ncbi:ankyrin [Xylariaceae sp. AK1471]|nr:ankyrin [Xylariaceae sp. AK1471]
MSNRGSSNFLINHQNIEGHARVQNGHHYYLYPPSERISRDELREHRSGAVKKTLQFERINTRRQNIRVASLDTCRWFLQTREYLKWIDPNERASHFGFLCIKGKPGAGKSTLLKFLLENSEVNMPHAKTISFFFNSRGNDLERTTLGLYRALLVQIFDLFPDLIKALDKLGYTEVEYIERNGWQLHGLECLLCQVFQDLDGRHLACYIDALDECHEDEVRDLINFFEDIAQKLSSTETRLNVCFTRRHFPNTPIRKGLGLTLESQNEHAQDIQSYIDRKLQIGQSPQFGDIRAHIVEKASGVFLWVALVIPMLNKAFDKGNVWILRDLLRDLPSKLEDLYYGILSQDSDDIDDTVLCLQLVSFARRQLTLPELYFGIHARHSDNDRSSKLINEVTTADMRRSILNLSRGLVEETKSETVPTLQFIHETVHDFILQGNWLYRIDPSFTGNVEGLSHEMLKNVCLKHIQLVQFNIETTSHYSQEHSKPHLQYLICRTSTDMPLHQQLNDLPFLEFAIEGVLFHAEKAQSLGVPQLDFMSVFPLDTWVSQYNGLVMAAKRVQQLGVTMLHLLAERNLHHLVRNHPERLHHAKVEGGRYRYPLVAALVSANREVAEDLGWLIINAATNLSTVDNDGSTRNSMRTWAHALEEHVNLCGTIIPNPIVSLDISDDFKRSPLSYVAEDGHINVARMLLSMGVDPDSRSKEGRSPLSFAAERNAVDFSAGYIQASPPMAQLLLRLDRVDGDSHDIYNRTPLSYAASAYQGTIDIIEALLLGGAEADSRDDYGRTPLSYAAEANFPGAVKVLLDTGRVEADSHDKSCRTPLSYAAQNSSPIDVEALLATRKVNVDARDRSGRTPLSYAIEARSISCLKSLLSIGKANPDSPDNSGQSPLHWVMKIQSSWPHELLEGCRILLETGFVNVEAKDAQGRTPLDIAQARLNEMQNESGTLAFSGRFKKSLENCIRLLQYYFENGILAEEEQSTEWVVWSWEEFGILED